MLDAIVPFILIGILFVGWLMDKAGFKFKNDSPEAMAEFGKKVDIVRDRRMARSIEAEARAIVSREKREIELRAALERVRASEPQ